MLFVLAFHTMKTLPIFFAGLAVWLVFAAPAPAEDTVSEEQAQEMFLDYVALAERCWPDLRDENTTLYQRVLTLFKAAPSSKGNEWLAEDPRRAFLLAQIAAGQLGIKPVDGAPVLELKPIRVIRKAPVTSAPAAPATIQPQAGLSTAELMTILEREDRLRSRALSGRTEPDPDQEALDSARVRQQLLDSRIAEIQRQLRKLERR